MKRKGYNSEKLQILKKNFQNLHPKSGPISRFDEEPLSSHVIQHNHQAMNLDELICGAMPILLQ